MHFKSLVSPGLRGGPFNLWHTQTLEKRRKASWWFTPFLLLNRALIYRHLRKSLGLLGGLSPWQEGMGCSHKDTLKMHLGLQQCRLEFSLWRWKTIRLPYKPFHDLYLAEHKQCYDECLPPPQGKPHFLISKIHFLSLSLTITQSREQWMYWFLVWFLGFSLKAGETWADRRPGQCWPENRAAGIDPNPDSHHQYTHLPFTSVSFLWPGISPPA